MNESNTHEFKSLVPFIIEDSQARAIVIPHDKGIIIQPIIGDPYRYHPQTTLTLYNITPQEDVITWSNELAQFVLPMDLQLKEALLKKGYKHDQHLFVPFSNNGDYPAEFKEKWAELKVKRELANRKNTITALQENPVVKPLPLQFLINHCLEIPVSGLEVLDAYGVKELTPIVETDDCDFHLLGTYCKYGTILAFIDHLARTFVTLGCPYVVSHLKKCGYRNVAFGTYTIPFSEGERPTDPTLYEKFVHIGSKWDELSDLFDSEDD